MNGAQMVEEQHERQLLKADQPAMAQNKQTIIKNRKVKNAIENE